MSSELKTNKISPATGTTTTLGDASDVFQLPASAEIDIASGATLDVNGTIDATGATITGFPQGGLQHITTVTNTSDSSSVDISGCFTSSYNKYRVMINNIAPVTNTVHIYIQFGNSDLSTISTRYQYVMAQYAASAVTMGPYHENSNTSSGIRLATDMANSSNYGCNFGLDIHNPYQNDLFTSYHGQGWAFNNSGNYANTWMLIGNTMSADLSARDESMRIVAQSGNIAGRTGASVTVYGYAES